MTWLERVTAPDGPPFALLHRPGHDPDTIDLIIGTADTVERIADIPLPVEGGTGARHDLLAILPYRQIRERGFEAPDDAAPLVTIAVTEQQRLPIAEVLATLPQAPIEYDGGHFDLDDDEYAALVQQVIDDEIGTGAGANFVLKRSFHTEITGWSTRTALIFFRRLLGRDPGAHWTFLVHTGERTLIGSSPERHVTLDAGTVTMNPISGTYRYPPGGPHLAGMLDFLADAKEANELSMVLDEELKMMGRICDRGARAIGPQLKQMARVAHTEYLIEGRSTRDVRDILRETLFAPTVVGGPLESACRVVARYEPGGRDYYAGLIALIGRDSEGARQLDSAILIRTADIDLAGRMRIGVGATLVRDSQPVTEAAETRAKAAGLLEALADQPGAPATWPDTSVGLHPSIRHALATRNRPLADFWFDDPEDRDRIQPGLAGRRVLVIDAEDTFTEMLRHALVALGFEVEVRRFDEAYDLDRHDLVVLGPGPGDPRQFTDHKIMTLRTAARRLLALGVPFFAICLGHQVLSTVLGLEVTRIPFPNQGTQRRIPFRHRTELVGFYNTFAAQSPTPEITSPDRPGAITVLREADSGEVHGLIGPGFASVQFHPESVLTPGGIRIIGELLGEVLPQRVRSIADHRSLVATSTGFLASEATVQATARR
ncbi:anthranilate synthase family protein [Micromonospora sp. NBC_01739]|uniref:anthranilate synthase family protein n=1 Tax=Micromonospora sp. NBC_01739 TaxID=2975985 RepID=UPI002E123A7F|nr:chorismate-binding protein [Micromonospora sp. NBC_01739]